MAALILSLFWAAWHFPLFSFVMGVKTMGLAAVPGWFFFMVTVWRLAVLAWEGPKNLSRRRRKQEASDLSALGEARVV